MAAPWEKYQSQNGPWDKYTKQPPQEKDFLGRMAENVSGRYDKTVEMVERRTSGGLARDVANLPAIGALAAGQVAGVGVDVVGETVKSGYENLVPGKAQDYIEGKIGDILQTDTGKMLISALQKGQEAYSSVAEKYPDAAMALEGVVNVSAFGVGKGATKQTLKEISKTKRDVAVLANKTMPGKVESNIYTTVKKGIDKAIRPTVAGKRTAGQTNKYYSKAKQAVEAIVRNKNRLNLTDDLGNPVDGLPQNLAQFTQAVASTKKTVFKQYDELAKSTKQLIDPKPIIRQLRIFSKNKSVNLVSPGAAKYADEVAARLANYGTDTAQGIQDTIAMFNANLKSFYQNPSYSSASKAQVDALVANNLRRKLDKMITRATGKGYRELKEQYGALIAIEREVNHRAIIDARKNVKGLVDFSDIYSGAQAVHAIATQNPALYASAATAKGIARYYKMLNDPNNVVKKMFSEVDDLLNVKGDITTPFEAQSLMGGKVQEGINKIDGLKKFNPQNPFPKQ